MHLKGCTITSRVKAVIIERMCSRHLYGHVSCLVAIVPFYSCKTWVHLTVGKDWSSLPDHHVIWSVGDLIQFSSFQIQRWAASRRTAGCWPWTFFWNSSQYIEDPSILSRNPFLLSLLDIGNLEQSFSQTTGIWFCSWLLHKSTEPEWRATAD